MRSGNVRRAADERLGSGESSLVGSSESRAAFADGDPSPKAHAACVSYRLPQTTARDSEIPRCALLGPANQQRGNRSRRRADGGTPRRGESDREFAGRFCEDGRIRTSRRIGTYPDDIMTRSPQLLDRSAGKVFIRQKPHCAQTDISASG